MTRNTDEQVRFQDQLLFISISIHSFLIIIQMKPFSTST